MVGDTKTSAVPSDHLGWMKCNGRLLSVSEYYQLWRVIGYSFGGSNDVFQIPDAEGRVPGFIGTGTDTYTSNFTFALGDMPGEYRHQLSIDEMPSHTHGSSNVSGNTNGNSNTTSNGTHAHSITDPGHYHTYLGVTGQGVLGGNTDTAADEIDRPTENTSSNVTGITIDSNGLHNHLIYNTGGSNFHMNIQPTIVIGNLFIYSGKPITPFNGYPYTENTQIL